MCISLQLSIKCCVLTTIEYVGYDDIKKYLENCLKISGAVHPNVLKIVGISFSSLSTVSIVLPYMEENDLLTYLKKLRSSVISSTPPEVIQL